MEEPFPLKLTPPPILNISCLGPVKDVLLTLELLKRMF